MESGGQPKSASSALAVIFASGSSPDRNTLLGPIADGFVMIVMAAVFIVFTILASGKAVCSCSPRLEFG
jgi:hypothetical protein